MIYPNVLPAEQINNFIQLAIAKGEGAKIKRIVADAYVMLGYVLGQAVGEPEAALVGMSPIEHCETMKGQLAQMNSDWQIVLGGLLATLTAWYQSKQKPK